jgi:hypothetical protein
MRQTRQIVTPTVLAAQGARATLNAYFGLNFRRPSPFSQQRRYCMAVFLRLDAKE